MYVVKYSIMLYICMFIESTVHSYREYSCSFNETFIKSVIEDLLLKINIFCNLFKMCFISVFTIFTGT